MSAPRVAVIGARRVRQGLGPFVARDLRAAGAEVPCFLTTRPESVEEAARGLREVAGVDARGYVDLDELIAREAPDALAILSPAETHAGILEQAAAAGLHVLCEKPFIWGETRAATHCREILAAFEAARRLVWENCQWPYALPAFEALHPGGLDGPPRRFEMELQPASRGLQSLADALPHPLSLLQVLSPGEPKIRDVWFSTLSEHAESMSLGFVYEAGGRDMEVEIKLSSSETALRRAAFCIDGRRAERLVSGADYRLSLATADRSVPLADPLTQLVADFVETLRGTCDEARNPRAREIAQRMQLLMDVVSAYSREAGP
ncbi:MAG: Gfo/Idh/MocA family oxidoreductase [Myxococcota bacterium]